MIKIPSEVNENPVQQVIFYRKPKGKHQPAEALSIEEVKDMVSYCYCFKQFETDSLTLLIDINVGCSSSIYQM